MFQFRRLCYVIFQTRKLCIIPKESYHEPKYAYTSGGVGGRRALIRVGWVVLTWTPGSQTGSDTMKINGYHIWC
jgi:hypothetical protein